jgi:hypothetical protein
MVRRASIDLRGISVVRALVSIVLAVLLVGSPALAADPGETGLAFLKIGVGARAAAMGERNGRRAGSHRDLLEPGRDRERDGQRGPRHAQRVDLRRSLRVSRRRARVEGTGARIARRAVAHGRAARSGRVRQLHRVIPCLRLLHRRDVRAPLHALRRGGRHREGPLLQDRGQQRRFATDSAFAIAPRCGD